jgi:uncharacterized membrane protein YbaN (DUF454 family)
VHRHFLKGLFAHHKVIMVLRLSAGWLFIVLGIVGLFLPILQGLLFIAVGIALLADHIPMFARIRDAGYRRFPKLQRLVRRVRARLRLVRRSRR